MNFIDNFLNKTTMYRLVLYILLFLYFISLGLSAVGLLPYTIIDLLSSAFIIIFISFITNYIFSSVYKIPVNVESFYITALILFFIITPVQNGDYSHFLTIGIWASIWSMASKYIVTINNNHIFNPVAFAVLLTSMTIGESASWWVGTVYLLPFVIIGGLLIIRKIRRADMMYSLFIASIATIAISAVIEGVSPVSSIYQTSTNSAFFFFAFIMFTEPLTTPSTAWLRIAYGALVGILFAPDLHVGSIYTTPELAIVIGNIFSYIISPREKLILKLKQKINIARDTYDFVFSKDRDFSFLPGQYMEWTLASRESDSRGNRRFFTVASSPTEKDIHLGVKFYPEPSSFKNRLSCLNIGEEIIASQCAGDFVLPQNKDEKLVFIAGGIGITPFRSMIKYLIDVGEKRDITVFYSNKKINDIAYKEIFDQAQTQLEIKTIYTNTEDLDTSSIPHIYNGSLTSELIKKEVPDFLDRKFYISGPHGMVIAFEGILSDMGVRNENIRTDYFPGFV